MLIFFCLSGSILMGYGCEGSISENENRILIRVGDRVLTLHDFRSAFEIAKSAYPHNEMQHPSAFKAAQLRLLNQMTEELLLLERAGELDIEVTESELDAAVSKIKNDYPDDAFEQTLLEYAVSYDIWIHRLKVRLLMEKVIQAELGDLISITSKDILAYYQAHYQLKPLTEEESENINEMIVERLRRQKAEDAYHEWIKSLQERYPIHINSELWDRIIGS